jgi:SAM-dependent methyltransferase
MLVLSARGIPRKGDRILHVAPKGETRFARIYRGRAGDAYVSVDATEGTAMVQMDLRELQFADNSFDFISCCHVLEHIPDDHRAIEELYRVLSPAGTALLQVPIYGDQTQKVEEPRADDDFHEWHPGRDYHQRYLAAGFAVEDLSGRVWPRAMVEPLGLTEREDLFLCTKKREPLDAAWADR